MTHIEILLKALKEIGASPIVTPITGTLTFDERTAQINEVKWSGYSGFGFTFDFDKKGNLIGFGADE